MDKICNGSLAELAGSNSSDLQSWSNAKQAAGATKSSPRLAKLGNVPGLTDFLRHNVSQPAPPRRLRATPVRDPSGEASRFGSPSRRCDSVSELLGRPSLSPPRFKEPSQQQQQQQQQQQRNRLHSQSSQMRRNSSISSPGSGGHGVGLAGSVGSTLRQHSVGTLSVEGTVRSRESQLSARGQPQQQRSNGSVASVTSANHGTSNRPRPAALQMGGIGHSGSSAACSSPRDFLADAAPSRYQVTSDWAEGGNAIRMTPARSRGQDLLGCAHSPRDCRETADARRSLSPCLASSGRRGQPDAASPRSGSGILSPRNNLFGTTPRSGRPQPRSPGPTYQLTENWMMNSSPRFNSSPRPARENSMKATPRQSLTSLHRSSATSVATSPRSQSPTFNNSVDWMQYSKPPQALLHRRSRGGA